MNKIPHSPISIRSYVLRQGRFTPSQRQAIKTLWPLYGIEFKTELIDPRNLFSQSAPCVLEIGFGNGESLVKQAVASPEINFIGIEVHSPGIGFLLAEAKKQALSNLRVFQHDAIEVLRYCIADHSLDIIQIFFPDPWPKKRHHKRRLIKPSFVALLVRKLKKGGRLHCATDWQQYATHMMEILSDSELNNVAGDGKYFEDPYSLRPITKFEQRGLRLGHFIKDLVFKKKTDLY